jgi:putative exporter of polyketide antibiotics
MILWCIKITIVSIIIICIIHHLLFFLQNNFSIPKIKNFIDIPRKYEK